MNKWFTSKGGIVYELIDENESVGNNRRKVKNVSNGEIYDLVIRNFESSDLQKTIIDNAVKGAPCSSFLWVLDIVVLEENKFGYITEKYQEDQFVNVYDILKNKRQFSSKEMQIAALIELVDAFEILHAKGYCYQDFRFEDIKFNCDTGDVLFCYNESITPFGENLNFVHGLKYMAPEVAIKMFRPDMHSDRFSLAVLIFLLLTHAHPYDGVQRLAGQLTPALKQKVYSTEPVFIFHPTDASNRPDPQEDINAIKAWPTLPPFIQDLFIKTFTAGMPKLGMKRDKLEIDRRQRASEKEWRDAFHRWLDTVAACPSCGNGICVEIENGQIKASTCPYCKESINFSLPIFIIRKRGKVIRTVVLEDGKTVAKSSVTKERSNEPAFIIRRSKKRADIYGIENLLPYQWKCVQQGASDRLVKTHEVVAALNGVNIEFDYDFSGEILYKL